MYRPVLAALLFGIMQVSPSTMEESSAIHNLSIAPPNKPLEITKRLSASGVLVMDAKSGQKVYGKQIDVRRPMASLTKLMTALIIIENHELDEWVKVPKKASRIQGNNAYLPAGESFKVSDLLSALLIASANDAAYTLAVFHSGSQEDFVYEMNDRAKVLGLKDTRFNNPTGLDSFEQWSTPQDIAWLASYVMNYEEILKRLSKRGMTIYGSTGIAVDLIHTHTLLHKRYDEDKASIKAGKTGTTNGAKQCLLSLVEYGQKSYLVVLQYSSQRYEDMRTIMKFVELEDIYFEESAVNMSLMYDIP